MPRFLTHRSRLVYNFAFLGLTAILLVILAFSNWMVSVIGFAILGVLAYRIIRIEKQIEVELEEYISTLSYRVKKIGEDIVSEVPIGIMLYDEEHEVKWHNKHLLELLAIDHSVIGEKLDDLIPKLSSIISEEEEVGMIRYGDSVLQTIHHPEERRLYFYDQTDYHKLQVKHRQERNVFLTLNIDNIDEASQGLDEQRRAVLLSEVTKALDAWSKETGIYLRRTGADKFFGILKEQGLKKLEENKFDILDTVRELTQQNKMPVTLSIGVGAGADELSELGQLAQSSLDIALGRGGDQAAVKRGDGKIVFYGGKSSAVEKRTRVRARVIAHALREIIQESDKVFIMGHRNPDMDSVGASLGLIRAVQANDKEAYIVLDIQQTEPGVEKLLQEIRASEELQAHFISPEDAFNIKTERSLLIVVDVHRPSLTHEPKLIDAITRRVVIDHHRRGEEFIPDPLLVYIEPYASSASELVTELLEYQGKTISLNKVEATAMLAGIVVDTKSFAFRTGSRTFEAASYLRNQGAETSLVQKLLKEDIDQFAQRARIVAGAKIYREMIAIAVNEEENKFGQVLMAQAADTLLTMTGISASFVISKKEPNSVAISARSLGDINVQLIMEKLDGGGHLTNAATQLEDISIEEAEKMLIDVIDQYLNEEEN